MKKNHIIHEIKGDIQENKKGMDIINKKRIEVFDIIRYLKSIYEIYTSIARMIKMAYGDPIEQVSNAFIQNVDKQDFRISGDVSIGIEN